MKDQEIIWWMKIVGYLILSSMVVMTIQLRDMLPYNIGADNLMWFPLLTLCIITIICFEKEK